MKKIAYLFCISLLFLFLGCSDDCEGENPTVTLANNGTAKADIQIKTSGGNTENVNNIEVGTVSERRSFAPGTIEFTISIQGEEENIVYTLPVFFCTDYYVSINPDNSVSAISMSRDLI